MRGVELEHIEKEAVASSSFDRCKAAKPLLFASSTFRMTSRLALERARFNLSSLTRDALKVQPEGHLSRQSAFRKTSTLSWKGVEQRRRANTRARCRGLLGHYCDGDRAAAHGELVRVCNCH